LSDTGVFTNVSKGMLASSKDLVDAFGTNDHQQLVCQEVQVSEQEGVALLGKFYVTSLWISL